MVLKLYGLPMSTCTTRVMICLHEKDLEFELVPVDLFTQENKKPPFLAKNVTNLLLKTLQFHCYKTYICQNHFLMISYNYCPV